MKARVLTIVLLAALIVGSGVPGLAEEKAHPAAEGWGAPRVMRPPARVPEGEAALPWFAPERAGPGAVITVTTTGDELNADGDCSLREAIQAANVNGPVDACVAGSGDDSVLVPGGTYLLTISGANEDANQTGDLDILDNLVLVGDGAEVTVLDGNGLDRLLQIHTGRTAEINALTVTGGRLIDDNGSGIYNMGTLTVNDATVRGNALQSALGYVGAVANEAWVQDATATLNHCLIADNTAPRGAGLSTHASYGLTAELHVSDSTINGNTASPYGGGGLYVGYGVPPAVSILTLTDSLVIGNSTLGSGNGGGILAVGDQGADAYSSTTLVRTTVHENTAINDPSTYGAQGAGLLIMEATTTVLDSTISGNVATGIGDLQPALGGGIAIWDSDVTLSNTTVSGNQVLGEAGGSGGGGGIGFFTDYAPASLTLLNVTLAGNSVATGGGAILYANIFGFTPVVTFKNTLIGGNTAPVDPSCQYADFGHGPPEFISLGNNLEDYDLCEFDEPTDLPNTDALLGPLGDYGGPTWTHPLLTGSPAVNAGDDTACPPADQRGVPRPQGPASDIGAYEAEALHVGNIVGHFSQDPYGRTLLRAKVAVHGASHQPAGDVAVDASIWSPVGGPYARTRTTKLATGVASFPWGSRVAGTWQLCVDGLTKDGYVYVPGDNEITCQTWES